MPRTVVDRRDLQGNILCGYGNAFRYGLYAFLQVHEATAGRALLDEIRRMGITTAEHWPSADGARFAWRRQRFLKPGATLNVALTHGGLRAIGVPGEVLAAFPHEFAEGMAARSRLLGDTGASDPGHWDEGLRRPHLLVSVMARSKEALEERRDWLRGQVAASGSRLSVVHEQRAGLLEDYVRQGVFGREHFGFADGVSQPSIAAPRTGPERRRGKGTPARLMRWNDVAPGEFVLGYPDEDGVDTSDIPRRLRRNGSFMVVRKLHQDVAGFGGYLREAAGPDPGGVELLAAKIMGRWRSGAPLALSPERDDPELTAAGKKAGRINDFRYRRDLEGLRCPVGAHIRRANPRDALGWEGKLTKRHRIIRRGMPYGPVLPEGRDDDGVDRGLMFICYQASIARQFEVIQARWLNDGDVFGLGSDKDFLLCGPDPTGKMTIPVKGRPPIFLSPQPAFVATKGGDYFFAPGLSALRELAKGL